MSEVPEETSSEQPAPFVPPAPEVLEGLLPRYVITQLIAHGGIGVVYSGLQRDLDRPVAIKILPPEAARDRESIDRFRTEARAMARLSHPHIPAVFDFEVVAEFCVLVMELVEGPNVYTMIREGKITPPMALEVLAQVCDAVQFAHSRGIIHGDIKPGNVLMNQDGQVKLADFGLARLMGQGSRDSESWTPMGTPEYAAPELYDKNAVPDHRADIYSLGVVLHEMLTGSPPVGEFELPGEAMGLDPRVDEIIAHCMELNPDSRYQTAQEVRVILREIIEKKNVPVPMSVKAPSKRIVRATRRTPAGVKIASSKKRTPASQQIPPATRKEMGGGTPAEMRPASGKSLSKNRRKIVVVEGAAPVGGLSDEAKRGILIGLALVVIAVALWLILNKGDKKDPARDKKDTVTQVEPVVSPPPDVPPPSPPVVSTPPVTPPPPENTPPRPKPPVYPPVAEPPVTPAPTAAYARIHELRITQRDEWNKKVEAKLNDEITRISGLYSQALQKLADSYLGKGDAASVLAIRDEEARFNKTHESLKTAEISKIAALARNQQALNTQLGKLRAGVKFDADAVKEKYLLGLREIEKQMDAAEDKAGSKVASDEFQKVTKLTDTDLRNYFNAGDEK